MKTCKKSIGDEEEEKYEASIKKEKRFMTQTFFFNRKFNIILWVKQFCLEPNIHNEVKFRFWTSK